MITIKVSKVMCFKGNHTILLRRGCTEFRIQRLMRSSLRCKYAGSLGRQHAGLGPQRVELLCASPKAPKSRLCSKRYSKPL